MPTASAHVWGNTTFTYKRQLNITVNENVTDFQIYKNITNMTNMQANASDIRFLDITETIALPYWIENISEGNWATVWIKGNFTTNNGTQAYMYYGNTSAASQSNGSTVFLSFDDAEYADAVTNHGWAYSENSGNTITATSQAHSYAGNRSILFDANAGSSIDTIYRGFDAQTTKVRIVSSYMTTTNPGLSYFTGTFSSADGPSRSVAERCAYVGWTGDISDDIVHYNNVDWVEILDGWTPGTWYKMQRIINITEDTIDFFINGVYKTTESCRENPSTTNLSYTLYTSGNIISNSYIDNIYVTKYISPEPVITIGAESVDEIPTYLFMNIYDEITSNRILIDDKGYYVSIANSSTSETWAKYIKYNNSDAFATPALACDKSKTTLAQINGAGNYVSCALSIRDR